MRRRVGQAAGCRVTSVGVEIRRCAGALNSTRWGDRRRCRVALTSSGFDYPGDQAKAGKRVRVAEGGGGSIPRDRSPPCRARVRVVQHVLGDRRQCRVAPTSSGFDYPGAKAKAGTQVRVCRHGVILCLRARPQIEAHWHGLSGAALPRGGKPRGYGPGECGFGGRGRRARRRGSRAASRQGRQGRWRRASAASRQGRQGRWRRARAARAARPEARAASQAAKRGGGKGGKGGDAGGSPCGACALPGGAAAASGGAGDLPCGYVREREGFAPRYQHGGPGRDGG